MEFKNFKKDVEAAFNNMIAENLFVANVDKDLLWMGYLLSFEDETVRQDHNCNACKSFIRHYGKVVAIDPQTYKTKTFWDDVHTPGYEKTAQALAKLVKEAGIGDVFIQDVNEFHGCDQAWLVFRPNMPTSDIHGEGYDFEEIGLFGTEAVLKYFEANTPNYVDCGTDVDKFINICLQFK